MDFSSMADFIRMQKEALAKEKTEYGLVSSSKANLASRESPNGSVDRIDEQEISSGRQHNSFPSLTDVPHPVDASPEPPQEPCNIRRPSPMLSISCRASKFESDNNEEHCPRTVRSSRRSEPPVLPSVSESFYNYFPSFNPKKQQTLQERRRDYFEYLKKATPTSPESREDILVDMDSHRTLEKERLVAQFQQSKQKSILNYQIVEARNRRAEEEAQRKKQQYFDDLKKQIEEQKRLREGQKNNNCGQRRLHRRTIHQDHWEDLVDSNQAQYGQDPQEPLHRGTFSDARGESDRKTQEDNKENDIGGHAAGENRELVLHKPESKQCCEHYKQILEKLENLCKWRDEFMASKKTMDGCILCDSGQLRNCNFCDYHRTMLKAPERYEDSITTDSDTDSIKFDPRLNRMIDNPLADLQTPQVPLKSKREPRNSSFMNFDEIPLPTQRNIKNVTPGVASKGRTRQAVLEGSEMSISRLRLNEMKKVEWKWNVPAVQRNSITSGQPEKVLTQLGAIRKQLQMEQLKSD